MKNQSNQVTIQNYKVNIQNYKVNIQNYKVNIENYKVNKDWPGLRDAILDADAHPRQRFDHLLDRRLVGEREEYRRWNIKETYGLETPSFFTLFHI